MRAFEETKFIMKKYGISANKSLGQNFLINDEVITIDDLDGFSEELKDTVDLLRVKIRY